MQPPADSAGGFMLVKYTNGVDTHRARLHLAPFNTNGWTGAIQGGATVDYGYTASGLQQTEATIAQTWLAFVTQAKVFYAAAWTFTLDQLYQIVNGEPVMVPVPPNPTAVVGTAGTASSTLDRYTAMISSFRTLGGHRARVELVGGYQFSTFTVNNDPASTGLGGYVTGSATAIVAHDGTHMLGPGHQTFAQLKRLRRRYGFA